MADYELAQEIKVIAGRLIRDHHKRLKDMRVEYLFLVEKPKKQQKAREKPGDVKVITGLNAYLAGDVEDPYPEPFFVLLMRRHVWQRVEDERHREALVDWYLCRMGFDPKTGRPKKVSADFAGYHENLERYGPWHAEMRQALKAAGNFELPFDKTPHDKEDAAAARGKTKGIRVRKPSRAQKEV